MKSWRKFLKILLCLSAVCFVFYLGGIVGYMQGYGDGSNAPVNATYHVSVLDSIRRGNSKMAVSMLDTELDTNIIYHWTLHNRGRSLFDVMGFGKYDKGFMESVAAYRKNQPLKDSDKEIKSVLHQYSTSRHMRK